MHNYASYICKECLIGMCCHKACNKIMLNIITKHEDHFKVNPGSQIIRNHTRPSDSWIFLGLSHIKRNEFISFERITPENINDFKTFKNGNPQWTVRDLDYGTIRNWGGGIKSIYFEMEGDI